MATSFARPTDAGTAPRPGGSALVIWARAAARRGARSSRHVAAGRCSEVEQTAAVASCRGLGSGVPVRPTGACLGKQPGQGVDERTQRSSPPDKQG